MATKKPDDRVLLFQVLKALWDDPPWPLRFWKGDFWHWRGNCYHHISEADLAALFQDGLVSIQHPITTDTIRRCLDATRRTVKVPDYEAMPVMMNDLEPDFYSPQPDVFAFRNVVLDLAPFLRTGVAASYEHTPLLFSDQCVDYDYDPRATCPRFLETLKYACDDDKERMMVLQMWCGYLLTKDTSQQKFLLMHGKAGTGKSVIATMIRFLLGERSVSFVPLKSFTDKFSLARVVGKRLNIDTDMASLEGVAEEVLKPWTGGDPIQVERKYRDPYDTVPEARLMFITNNLPHISDKSNAVWRRMILLPFNRVVPDSMRRTDYISQTVEGWAFRDELPGIWNWASLGLRLLREQGVFPEPKACREAREEYKIESNPIAQWLLERCRVGAEHRIRKEDALSSYTAWAEVNGFRRMSMVGFGRGLLAAAPEIESIRVMETGLRRQYYHGLYIVP